MTNKRGTPDQPLEEARNRKDDPPNPAYRLVKTAHREALARLGHPREVS
jgi:hypothetical protein